VAPYIGKPAREDCTATVLSHIRLRSGAASSDGALLMRSGATSSDGASVVRCGATLLRGSSEDDDDGSIAAYRSIAA
jgi:hypothetical protein